MQYVNPADVSVFDARVYGAPIAAQRQMQMQNALAQALAGTPLPPGTQTFNELGAPRAVQYNALSEHGGPTNAAAGAVGNYLRYGDGFSGKIRNKPVSDRLEGALSYLGDMGITAEVFSGGQAPKGSGGPRTGSTRHDHGHAADVFFYRNGRRLNWANPEDVPVFQEIVRRGRANGLTGFGAGPGYMPEGSMHIGFGTPAVWGAGGSSENAPQWLREAFLADLGL